MSKNPSTKKLQVDSVAYQLSAADAQGFSLFPTRANEEHSFCYVVIEPLKRHATIWYLAHMPLF